MKNQKGFTIIEILIVMAIIGFLSTMTLVSFAGARAAARDTKRLSDIRTIQSTLEVYNNAMGVYPAVTTNTMAALQTELQKVLGSTFTLPNDPTFATTPYVYCNSTNAGITGYVLRADLEGNNSVLATAPRDIDGSIACTTAGAGPIACDDTTAGPPATTPYNYCVTGL